jgi:predicted TIM-barrel fold metal-dependent hydrolase
VLIHTNEPVGHLYPGKSPNTLGQIYEMVKRFSENKIVLGHWGGGIFFFHLLKKESKNVLKNVYYDTAASPLLYDVDIYTTAVKLAGLEKILFGSDFPLIRQSRYFGEFARSTLSDDEIKSVCGKNARKLLKV